MPLRDERAERRTSLLDAARAVFAARGYAAACVDEIARRAGVAKGTVYLYYPSKEALCEAVIGEGTKEVLARVRARVGAAAGARAKIAAFFDARLDFFEENRAFLRMYLSEFGNVHANPVRPRAEFARSQREQAALLAEVLREGMRAGEIRIVPVAATARALLDLSRGQVLALLAGAGRAGRRSSVPQLLDLVWRGLAP